MTNSLTLHPKLVGGSLSGVVTLIVLQILAHFHVSITMEDSAAATLIISSVGAWLAPVAKEEQKKLLNPNASGTVASNYPTITGPLPVAPKAPTKAKP